MTWKTVPGYVFELCRKMRADGTDTERVLWECLRNRRLGGFKFRRQHPIGRYIADFYCSQAGLVIELDGSIHREVEQQEYDCIRDEYLRERGLRVIRITNQQNRDDFENVVERIESILKDLAP